MPQSQYFSSGNLDRMLSGITATLTGFFEKSNSVVGVDIGSSAIKVVQLKRKEGKAILETYGELALGPYAKRAIGEATSLAADKVSEALVDVMREASVSARDTGMAIPLSSSLITLFEMVSVKSAKLEEMVPLEARKYIPVPMSEVNSDWRVVPREESSSKAGDKEKVRILFAAIHNEVLNRYQKIALNAKLEVQFFEIEVFSTLRAILGREQGVVFVLDIGAGTSKLLIVENGVVASSHIINRGSQDITRAIARGRSISTVRAEEIKREVGLSSDPQYKDIHELSMLIIGNIFTDVERVLIDHEKRTRTPVGKVILSGGGSLLKGIGEAAEKHFEVSVERAHPFAKVETPAFLEPVLRDAGPNFAVALGLAFRRLEELE